MLIPTIISGIIFFITYTLEVITGFGGAVLAMPFVTSLIGMREGVMVITSLGWALALYIAITNWKKINWPQFFRICGSMLIGLPLGMYLFRKFDVNFLKHFLAVFIVSVSLWHLAMRLFIKKPNASNSPENSPQKGWKLIPYFFVLVAGGIVHGMLSIGGPLLVIYASKALPEKGAFRSTLCLLWSVLNTVIIAMYFIERSYTVQAAGTIGIITPFVVLGIVLGEKIHTRLNEQFFSILVFAMLLVTGGIIFFL
jgi:uncharacterized membrane protein YfcA